jgi:hypothetical protein
MEGAWLRTQLTRAQIYAGNVQCICCMYTSMAAQCFYPCVFRMQIAEIRCGMSVPTPCRENLYSVYTFNLHLFDPAHFPLPLPPFFVFYYHVKLLILLSDLSLQPPGLNTYTVSRASCIWQNENGSCEAGPNSKMLVKFHRSNGSFPNPLN